MSGQPGILVASRSDRLGARLIAIANTKRLARDYELGYRIHWLKKWELTEPAELFDTAFIDEFFMSTEEYRAWRGRKATPLASYGNDPDETRMVSLLRSGESDVEIDTVFDIFRFPKEDAQSVARSFASAVAEIPFAADLKPAMRQLRARMNAGDVPSVAYHIRRGDLTTNIQAMNRPWGDKFVPEVFYERHLEARMDETSEKVIFSDNPEIIEKFTKKFPKLRVFSDLIEVQGLSQAQTDFLELYAMSCCQSIIAPPASAFSRTASAIGNSQLSSVEDELTPEQRNKALDVLCAQLADEPTHFANEGEIGQSLVHAEKHLVADERTGELVDIMTGYVERGMCLSFVFAKLFRHLFRAGRYDEILRMWEYVEAGYVYHLRSYAQIALYHGCALIMLGRRREGLEQISSAFWHEPVEGEISALCYVLLAQGDFGPENFWFSDTSITRYMSNSWSERYLREHFSPMIEADVLTVPSQMGACRPLVWEWSEFTRAHLNKHFRFRGQFKALIRHFNARRWHEDVKPNANSFNALVHAREGEFETALELSRAAVAAQPDNALFHKRQSDAFAGLEDLGNAVAHIERATELQPDARMFHALHGHLLNRHGKLDAASEAYGRALDGDQLAFPTILFQAAEINRKRGDLDLAERQLSRGLSLSPTHWRLQIDRGEILAELGRPEEAIDVYLRTHRWANNRLAVTRGLANLMRREGMVKEARNLVKETMSRNPDKKQQFANLLKKLKQKS